MARADRVDPPSSSGETVSEPSCKKIRARSKKIPSRSVSPANQGAGILFRMSPASLIESICVGNFEVTGNMSLAGQPIPPLSRDYGFSYMIGKLSSTTTTTTASRGEDGGSGRSNTFPLSLPKECFSDSDAADDDFEGRDRPSGGGAPPPSGSGRGRGRKVVAGPRLCISCGATKTPYWREAWSSSVLLCNACGLRFSKFKRRCLDCSYVPRKEDKGSKACTKCGGPWS